MRIDKIVVGQLEVNCYIVSEERSGGALIIDPGDEFERIADLIDGIGVKPIYLLCTHAHYDHVCAANELKDKYQCIFLMHEEEKSTYEMTKRMCVSRGFEPADFPPPDRAVKDKEKIALGKIVFELIHTPGHSPGSICIYGKRCLFSGDTLFRGSAGRTDLPGGDTEKLMSSLQKLILLPPDTKVLCGHGEETTIGEESAKNPFINKGFGLRFR